MYYPIYVIYNQPYTRTLYCPLLAMSDNSKFSQQEIAATADAYINYIQTLPNSSHAYMYIYRPSCSLQVCLGWEFPYLYHKLLF